MNKLDDQIYWSIESGESGINLIKKYPNIPLNQSATYLQADPIWTFLITLTVTSCSSELNKMMSRQVMENYKLDFDWFCSGIAEVNGPEYIDSSTECSLDFWIYKSGDVTVFTMMQHITLGFTTKLEALDSSVLEDAKWSKVQIGLGRHRDRFSVGFNLMYSDGKTT